MTLKEMRNTLLRSSYFEIFMFIICIMLFFDSDSEHHNNIVWCYISNLLRACVGIKINSMIPKSHEII